MKKKEIGVVKKRSRRRKDKGGRSLFLRMIMLLFFFLFLAVLFIGGRFGYQYAKGNATPHEPLESSREVLPETLEPLP